MINDTTLLVDLEGLAVERVERLTDGSRLIRLATDDATARACPACGTFATVPKGWAVTRHAGSSLRARSAAPDLA